MSKPEEEGRKASLIDRIDRLRELVVGDADAPMLDAALREVGRAFDALTRPGRAEGVPETPAGEGEPPAGL